MGLLDKVILKHDDRWGYWLQRGRETFYDENNRMRVWETPAEAAKWAKENLGVEIEVDPASAREAGSKPEENRPTEQPRLF